MRKILAIVICLIALVLPVRLRVLLCEVVGWMLQLVYWLAFRLARFLLRSLRD